MRVFHLNKVNKLVKNDRLRTFHFKLSKIVVDFDFDFSKVASCIMTDLKNFCLENCTMKPKHAR